MTSPVPSVPVALPRLIPSLVLVLLLAAGCRETVPRLSANGTDGNDRGCAEPFEPDSDPFPVEASLRHATGFSVSYHGSHKVVTLRDPTGTAAVERLILVQCGAPVPPLDGELAGAIVVEVPVARFATNDDGTVARLREMGLAGTLVAMGGGGIYDPDLRRRYEQGEIVGIGESFHGQPDLERLLAAAPELVILFSGGPAHAEALERIRRLGIPAVPSYAWKEPSHLGLAEWLKYPALFANAEAEAERRFETIERAYQELAREASRAARAADARGAGRPVAFWAENRGAAWIVHRDSWQARYLEAAGAENPFAARGEPTARLSTEAVLEAAADADVWITETPTADRMPPGVPLDAFAAHRGGRVFHPHARTRPEWDAWDWYETALVRPDLVLGDLVAILYPGLLGERRPVFFAPQSTREGAG